ncbi:type I phosphodiesterase/nucleotide pyrophosphatase [Paenibacillus larvae subsp. larvae DSM 25430]|nr:type I phosphodiesterase/nucleotide pyrophosphatase [Paenibacillus larvae subsp. larvae DSM 25430]
MAPFIFWNLAFYTIIRTQLGNIVGCTSLYEYQNKKSPSSVMDGELVITPFINL